MIVRFARVCAVAAAFAALLLPAGASAQGNLSAQGLGYPPGALSARSLGAGGALGEMDPTSALNPAAIIEFGAPALSMQLEPEFRRVTDNGQSANSSTQRFPVFVAALPFGEHLMIGASSATLLDRSWQTTTPQDQVIRGDSVLFNSTTTSNGSVNDLALTAAYVFRPWLRAGVAIHGVNGRDVVEVRRTFQDTVRYGNTIETVTNTYTGRAVSAGIEFVEPSLGGLALSYRRGGGLKQTVGDTLIESAHVPDRFGLGLAFNGFSGTTLALRTAYDRWSALGNMDSASGAAMNSWDTSFGAEFSGPRLGGFPLALRLGTRWRNLPFPADGHQVHEASFTGGLGLTLARGHALFDIAGVHAARSAGIGISEQAWTLSMGLTIRP
ncbi:MAG TPA: hypothetical protein VF737_09580 [Gemmatimonadaceae bacterium]